ncbi:MAG: amidohydrolase family protein [Anaerolineales bacterium]|nr:amidohydrolase family protein [Anaerolineales bacterium]
MQELIITNIKNIVSGDIYHPLLAGDSIFISKKKIKAVGFISEMQLSGTEARLDAQGGTVTPGLIDSHQHPGAGDYTPTAGVTMVGWAYGKLRGGVTTIISAGEIHLPGRPSDRTGTKAMAIYFYNSYKSYRPSGVKVHGGALVLTPDLCESDFEELAQNGVWLVGEVCAPFSIPYPNLVAPLTAWARKAGMKVQMHVSGAHLTYQEIRLVNPHVLCHINGGLCALRHSVAEQAIAGYDGYFELVPNGNPRATRSVISLAQENDRLDRIIIGSDDPGGLGLAPLGVLSMVLRISAEYEIPAHISLAMATGNTARAYDLETGIIAPGKAADLIVLKKHPDSAAGDALESLESGDMPLVTSIISDGIVLFNS